MMLKLPMKLHKEARSALREPQLLYLCTLDYQEQFGRRFKILYISASTESLIERSNQSRMLTGQSKLCDTFKTN